jgi:hypothetical protein
VRFKNAFRAAIFCVAAAVTAAAVSDPVMEWMSNRGTFGPGNFTDHSTRDVLPALCTGILLAALLIIGVVRRAASRSARAPEWLRNYVSASNDRALPRLLPAIFTIQLLILWSMESLEQIAVDGRPLGGAIWLGGPLAVSLLVHLAGCLLFTWLLARMLRWSAEAIVDVVSFIRQLLCAVLRDTGIRSSHSLDIPASRFIEPLLARLNGRAPPYRTSHTTAPAIM